MPQIQRVIVAPHADDEVLGCGGLLARFPHDTAVIVLVYPDDVRYKEFEEARRILGYQTYFLLDHQDGSVHHDMRKVTGQLDNLLLAMKPDELYLPYPSSHQDHIAAYEAGIRAARLSMGSKHWYPPTVKVYDVAVYSDNLYQTGLTWNTFLSLDEAEVDKKVRALEMYSSQSVEGPHPANTIKGTAAALGAARRVDFAEQFSLVREVI